MGGLQVRRMFGANASLVRPGGLPFSDVLRRDQTYTRSWLDLLYSKSVVRSPDIVHVVRTRAQLPQNASRQYN